MASIIEIKSNSHEPLKIKVCDIIIHNEYKAFRKGWYTIEKYKIDGVFKGVFVFVYKATAKNAKNINNSSLLLYKLNEFPTGATLYDSEF